MQFQRLIVDQCDSGKRLDTYLSAKLNISRNQAINLIKGSLVKLNHKDVPKNGIRINLNDEIHYKIEKKTEKKISKSVFDLKVIYEDEEILVVNKNSGISVHPSESNKSDETIIDKVIAKYPDAKLAHRLDKDTSGALIIAKSLKIKNRLSKLFQDRKVKKIYLALVKGTPKTEKGRIEAALKRSTKDKKKIAISNQGRNAISKFQVKEIYNNCSLLEVEIETGRTHQIRVHMASIGHPIIGDKTYGDAKINEEFEKTFNLKRQFLHSYIIEIEDKKLKAPLTSDLLRVRKLLNQA